MNENVLSLVPNAALATDIDQIAQRLERLAQRIREGEWTDLRRVLVVLDTGDQVHDLCYGQPTTNAELVGVLEYTKRKVMG